MWDPKTGGVHFSHDVIWLRQMFYKAKTATNYVEVNVEPEEMIHKTIEADEDAQSSSKSSNKSSESSESEVEELDKQETDSVHEDEGTLQDTLGDNQPDDPPVTRKQSGCAIQ
jgi:hypothetical protein